MPTIRRTIIAAALLLAASFASAQTETAFTYQGLLEFEGERYTGTADYRFGLWDAPSGGNLVGPESLAFGVAVDAGLFTASVDLGTGAHVPGRFLQIAVRTPAWDGTGEEPAFVAFPDRTPMTASPFSLNTRGIFVNEAGHGVGIGTTNPSHRLHIASPDQNSLLIESPSLLGSQINLTSTSLVGRSWRVSSDPHQGHLFFGHSEPGAVNFTPIFRLRPDGLRIESGRALIFGDGSEQRTAVARPISQQVDVNEFVVLGNSQGGFSTFIFGGAEPGMAVIVTPPYDLWPFHAIAYARVVSSGLVTVRIISNTSTDRVYGAGRWRITVFP